MAKLIITCPNCGSRNTMLSLKMGFTRVQCRVCRSVYETNITLKPVRVMELKRFEKNSAGQIVEGVISKFPKRRGPRSSGDTKKKSPRASTNN